ncbi:hypothetical protein [Weissella viridescens]
MQLYTVEGRFNGDERYSNHLTMAEAVAEKYNIIANYGAAPQDVWILEEA